ncbi:hypothetical protein AKJ08_1461 [Vulgatibacter incomptus]|uniref:Uncharacterized protein n=1 Tax=Vulgatibacter incomptus TaxID=1391653 RepID=A0A0K1PD76_9BACT|nr:hypothetical protein AKJ08_1461 [Vulgatibacter incomptus]
MLRHVSISPAQGCPAGRNRPGRAGGRTFESASFRPLQMVPAPTHGPLCLFPQTARENPISLCAGGSLPALPPPFQRSAKA